MRISKILAALVLLPAAALGAQGLDLTVNHVGLAIGNIPRVTGVRLNFRDSRLEYVHGVNATIWHSYGDPTGEVKGLALGVPLTELFSFDADPEKLDAMYKPLVDYCRKQAMSKRDIDRLINVAKSMFG